MREIGPFISCSSIKGSTEILNNEIGFVIAMPIVQLLQNFELDDHLEQVFRVYVNFGQLALMTFPSSSLHLIVIVPSFLWKIGT